MKWARAKLNDEREEEVTKNVEEMAQKERKERKERKTNDKMTNTQHPHNNYEKPTTSLSTGFRDRELFLVGAPGFQPGSPVGLGFAGPGDVDFGALRSLVEGSSLEDSTSGVGTYWERCTNRPRSSIAVFEP